MGIIKIIYYVKGIFNVCIFEDGMMCITCLFKKKIIKRRLITKKPNPGIDLITTDITHDNSRDSTCLLVHLEDLYTDDN